MPFIRSQSERGKEKDGFSLEGMPRSFQKVVENWGSHKRWIIDSARQLQMGQAWSRLKPLDTRTSSTGMLL